MGLESRPLITKDGLRIAKECLSQGLDRQILSLITPDNVITRYIAKDIVEMVERGQMEVV